VEDEARDARALPEFEVFTGPTGPRQEVTLTIQKSGVLTLSTAAYAALGKPAAVELLYAPKERTIGIRPTTLEQTPHGYQIRHHKASGSHMISGAAFCRHYEIAPAYRLPGQMIAGVLVVPLPAPEATA
jgi:hypothetical protein